MHDLNDFRVTRRETNHRMGIFGLRLSTLDGFVSSYEALNFVCCSPPTNHVHQSRSTRLRHLLWTRYKRINLIWLNPVMRCVSSPPHLMMTMESVVTQPAHNEAANGLSFMGNLSLMVWDCFVCDVNQTIDRERLHLSGIH